MIPVAKVRKPRGFDDKVTTPGDVWLAANPKAKRPKPLWLPYTAALSDGFGGLCGYAAMLDPTGGTVDHFLSVKHHRRLAYDWSNYRFASAAMNASKQSADAAVLDPYQIGDGWFEIVLPSLQMRVSNAVPPAMKASAEYTLQRLKLRDGERVIRWRQSWYSLYCSGGLTLDGLRQVAPLLATAVASAVADALPPPALKSRSPRPPPPAV